MVVVAGKPLIDHMLDRLAEAGVERAIVNVHAHADHLEAHLAKRKTGPEIIISDEREELLETGGGVVKALPLLGDDPIFICNIDAIWYPFEPVLETLTGHWNPQKMDELLLCARADWSLGYAGKGDFNIHEDARLTRRAGESAKHVYAGVQIFKPDLATPFKIERFSRNKIWDETLKRRKLFGVELPGYWMHVGDPRAVIAAEAVLKEAAKNG
jgi:MurNAc alpha-1-phosphate uridylyltransferase